MQQNTDTSEAQRAKRRRQLIATMLAILAILGIVALLAWLTGRPPLFPPRARLQRTLTATAAGSPADTPRFHRVALAPDGTTVAAGSLDGGIWLWNLDETGDGTESWTLKTEAGVERLAFSNDGRTLAALQHDMTVQTWRLPDQAIEKITELPPGRPVDLVYDATDRLLLGVAEGDNVNLYDVHTGDQVRQIAFPFQPSMAAIHPDQQQIVVQATRQEGDGHTIETGVFTFAGDLLAPACRWLFPPQFVQFSPDGNQVTVETPAGASLYRRDNCGKRTLLQSNAGFANGASFSADGGLLALAWTDGAVQVWRVGN